MRVSNFKGKKHTKQTKLKISLKKRGVPSWNKGLKGFRAGEKRPNILPKGSANGSWKGDKVCYRGLHLWVQLMLGKPRYCSKCGVYGTGRKMHWANVTGKYLRDLNDWVRLCAKCHCKYDKEKGLRGHYKKII